MLDREKMIEAMARARWDRHYPVGPGSLAEKVVVPWERASPGSRREYLAEVAADLTALEALGCVVVPAIDEAALVEIADDCGWSLSICFGHGDKNRDRMHAYSDALRAMLAASPLHGREG